MERLRTVREAASRVLRHGPVVPGIRGGTLPAVRTASVLAISLLAACGSMRGEVPDFKAFSYPTAVVADPSGDTVYVVSTNFDSRWQYGWVSPIDARTSTILDAGAVETGSFAGEPAFSVETDAVRMVLPVRDDNSVVLIDRTTDGVGVPALSCGDAGDDGRRRCDGDSSIPLDGLAKDEDGEDIEADDPYAVAIGAPVVVPGDAGGPDTLERPLYVGSLQYGTVLLFSMKEGGKPVYQGYQVLQEGLHTLIEWPLSDDERVLLASTRLGNSIHVVRVRHAGGTWSARVDRSLVLPVSTSTGDYVRGMALSKRGPVVYAAYRAPSSLAILDLAADGRPSLRQLVALGGEPSGVAVHAPDGGPELVYVTDFGGDAVYVVDPSIPAVVDRFLVGQGPYGIAIAADRAFVANFEDQDVSVVPLGLDDPDRHRETKRLP